VNERAFLLPLESLSPNPNLRISINLPKLHPKYETPERHYVPGCDPPPFIITRRLRQAYHGVESNTGDLRVEWVQDFPILWDCDSDEDLEEEEAIERKMWEKGENVEQEVSTASSHLNMLRTMSPRNTN
jgi:hypothetical protein